jgi:large subunit ribosomal protein L23
MSPYDVIVRPVLSEKSMGNLTEGSTKYTFYVHPNASRTQVKDAIRQVFSVDVIKINVMTVNGKERTTGRYKGFRPKRKKAIVTLKPGQRITQLEGLS